MEDKLGIIIVTFNPTWEVFSIIESAHFSKNNIIIIVDNGTEENNIKNKLREYSKVNDYLYFFELDRNMGLGFAQNYGLKKLKKFNINYAVLFDQDSEVESSFFSNAVKNYKIAQNMFSDLGLLVPVYIDKKDKNLSVFTAKEGSKYKKTIIKEPYQKVAFANASGMVIKMDLFDKIGMMREDFFIDQIDVEFCMRVAKSGYSIVATDTMKIVHTVGEGESIKIFNHTIKHSNHNALRRYYIARNSMIVRKIYKDDYGFVKLIDKRLFKTFLVCLFEKKRFSKLFSIIRGIRDGLYYKY